MNPEANVLRHLKCNPRRFMVWWNPGLSRVWRESVNPLPLEVDLAASFERIRGLAKFHESVKRGADLRVPGSPGRQPVPEVCAEDRRGGAASSTRAGLTRISA
jgi:hypothetical protein